MGNHILKKQQTSNRILWLDYAKIAGIYLVIIGHGNLLAPEWKQYIFAFHMPLFFIISGMFFHVKRRETFIKSIITRMIVPYLIINVICLAIENFGKLFLGKWEMASFLKQLYAILLGVGYRTDYCEPVCTTLWFVVALIILHVLFNISASLKYVVFTTLVCIVSFIALKLINVDTWFPIDSAMLAAPFFSIGMLTQKYLISIGNNKKINVFLRGGFFLLVCYIINRYNGRVNINGSNYGSNILLCYLAGVTGSVGFLMLCKALPEKIDCSRFAKGTFLIMGFHLMFISVFKALFYKLCPSVELNSVIGMFIGLLILITFKPIIGLCSRYFPAILGNR